MNGRFYEEIRGIIEAARNKVYQTANSAMVEAYWLIGKSIIAEQGGEDRAEYGDRRAGLCLCERRSDQSDRACDGDGNRRGCLHGLHGFD